MVTATRMTLDEFLQLPETEPPSEFVCGRIVPKPFAPWNHGTLRARLAYCFEFYLMSRSEGFCQLGLRRTNQSESRAYVPDICVTRSDRAPRTLAERRHGAIESAPDIAIEVTSPEDRPGRIADKLAFYLRVGVPLVWIVDPEDRSVSVYRPGKPVEVLGRGDIIDAAPVLREFSLALEDLFSVLDQDLAT